MKEITEKDIENLRVALVGISSSVEQVKNAVIAVGTAARKAMEKMELDIKQMEMDEPKKKHIPFGRQYLQSKKKNHWV